MYKLLVIDNYDSFTYNLVQMFMHYDLEIWVYRSDKITLEKIENLDPDYALISPGPKDPKHAGISIPLIRSFCDKIPILGVCLGLQCINEAFGGTTVRAPVPMHGKTSMIRHNNYGIFIGIKSPFQAARYHSLMTEYFRLPPDTKKHAYTGQKRTKADICRPGTPKTREFRHFAVAGNGR